MDSHPRCVFCMQVHGMQQSCVYAAYTFMLQQQDLAGEWRC